MTETPDAQDPSAEGQELRKWALIEASSFLRFAGSHTVPELLAQASLIESWIKLGALPAASFAGRASEPISAAVELSPSSPALPRPGSARSAGVAEQFAAPELLLDHRAVCLQIPSIESSVGC